MQSGLRYIDTLSQGREREKVNKKLKDVTDRWNKVNRLAKERQDKIEQIIGIVSDYHYDTKIVEEVNKHGENVLKTLEPLGVDPEKGKQQLNKIRVSEIVVNDYGQFSAPGEI